MNDTNNQSIREKCRACLNTVTSTQTDTGGKKHITADDEEQSQSTNSLLSPNLGRLFLSFTTLDVSQEMEEFPKRLCQLCLAKLIEFEDFREKALASTRTLYHSLKNHLTEKTGKTPDDVRIHTGNSFVKEERTYSDSEIDPKDFCDVDIDDKDNDYKDFKIDMDENENFDADEHDGNDDEHESDDIDKDENGDNDDEDKKVHINDGADEQANDAANNTDEGVRSNSPGFRSELSSPVFDRLSENLDNEACETNSGDEDGSSVIPKNEKKPKKKIENAIMYCFTCEKQFRRQLCYEAHMLKVHHGIERPYSCKKCSKTFTTNKLLNVHVLDKCGVIKKDIIVLKDDIQYRAVKTCGKTLESQSTYSCEICGKNLQNKSSLKIHMKRHKDIKNYQCTICDVAKTTANELTIHMRVHDEDVEKFKCPQCPQMFNHKNAVTRHVRAKHEGVKRYACSHCPKRFATHNAQICHEKGTHGEGRNFLCKTCYRSFTLEKTLINHLKLHRKLPCNLCPKRFMNLKTLADHQKVHLGDNPLICTVCSHGFHNLDDLRDHSKQHENDICSDDKAECEGANSEAKLSKNTEEKMCDNTENSEICDTNEANNVLDSGFQKRSQKRKGERKTALRGKIKNKIDTDSVNKSQNNNNAKKKRLNKTAGATPESNNQENKRKKRSSARGSTRNSSAKNRSI